ncbi:MAG: hypothetical protein H6R23_1654, partial [Proteobacteria bacterium]|nr:hypothetical protein [Pseudomonadota bacterium]
ENAVVLRANRRLCSRQARLSRSTKLVLIVVLVVNAANRA